MAFHLVRETRRTVGPVAGAAAEVVVAAACRLRASTANKHIKRGSGLRRMQSRALRMGIIGLTGRPALVGCCYSHTQEKHA